MCKVTRCVEDSCRWLLIGGEEPTYYYLCQKGYDDYCGEPESDYRTENGIDY